MSFIAIDGLDQAQEPTLVEEGTYDLVITNQETKKSEKTGRDCIHVNIEIQDVPDAQGILHVIALVTPEDEERSRKFMLLSLRRFLELFNIPYDANGFDPEDLIGAVAHSAMVEKVEREDKPGEFTNRLRLPHLSDKK